MSRLGRALALFAVLSLTAAASVEALKVPGSKFGKTGKASGEFAIAQASGSVNNPSKVFAKVTSKPSQRVSGAFSIVCSKGFGAGSKNGSINGVTPLARRIPFPMRRPNSCSVAANAQLQDGGGTVIVKLYAKR
jgi:hypothetical protein